MTIILAWYSTATGKTLSNFGQSTPFAHGFHLAGEAPSHSGSKSPELTSTWEEQENTKPADKGEDLELHQLMEDIKRYIRSIDIGNL